MPGALDGNQQKLVERLINAIDNRQLGKVKRIASEPAFKLDDESFSRINDKIQAIDSKAEQKQYIKSLTEHMLGHRTYPDDYTCLLMAEHVYEELDAGEVLRTRSPITPGTWEVHTVFNPRGDNHGYYGALYVNEETKQLVLAHRGSVFGLKDTFTRGGSAATDIDTVLRGNIGTKLHDQQLRGAELTYAAVNLIKEGGELEGYSLTITGHSLGGWLAQLSAFYCRHSTFLGGEQLDVRTVTFDAPGTKEMMEKLQERYNPIDLESLDIIDYISSSPNLVNCCNEHPVKPYKIEGVLKFEEVASWFKDTQRAGYSIMSHMLGSIKDAFDPVTGKPKEYSVVHNWPSIQYSGDGSSSVFMDIIPDVIPTSDSLFPGSSIAKEVGKKLLKGGTKFAASKIGQFAPLALANTVAELVKGDIQTSEFLTLFDKLKDDYTEREDLTFQDKFKLSFLNKFSVVPSQDYVHKLGSISHDQYIEQVLAVAKHSSSLSPITQEVVERFSQQIKILEDGHVFEVITIHEARDQALYIASVAQEIAEKANIVTKAELDLRLEDITVINGPNLATSIEIGYTEKFTHRAGPWSQLDKILSHSDAGDLAVIYGMPGTGKSTLAVKYAMSNFDIVRQLTNVNSKDGIYQGYLNMASGFDIPMDGLPESQDDWDILIHSVNTKIKHPPASTKKC